MSVLYVATRRPRVGLNGDTRALKAYTRGRVWLRFARRRRHELEKLKAFFQELRNLIRVHALLGPEEKKLASPPRGSDAPPLGEPFPHLRPEKLPHSRLAGTLQQKGGGEAGVFREIDVLDAKQPGDFVKKALRADGEIRQAELRGGEANDRLAMG